MSQFKILDAYDVTKAVVETQRLLESNGFKLATAVLVATAVSELARNALIYAGGGTVDLGMLTNSGRHGFEVVVKDEGPGIDDVDLAFQSGYSTKGTLGLGLPGVRRIMDEVEVDRNRLNGCKITARKWQ